MNAIEKDTLTESGRVEIVDALVNLIAEKIEAEMNDRIKNINPEDDPNAEYGERWEKGSCDGDDIIELDKPNDEYGISYHYTLSWRYRMWMEHWSDPCSTQFFDDMSGESGRVYDIEICTPDGDEVKDSICERIAEMVNEKIK